MAKSVPEWLPDRSSTATISEEKASLVPPPPPQILTHALLVKPQVCIYFCAYLIQFLGLEVHGSGPCFVQSHTFVRCSSGIGRLDTHADKGMREYHEAGEVV